MKDSHFLTWIADRIVNQYFEDENIDFVHHLRELAATAAEKEEEEASGLRVNLTYYREAGKFSTEGHYRTRQTDLWEIWVEVQRMLDERKLPGLIEGHDACFVTVDVPQHVNRHPHLILPLTMTGESTGRTL